MENKLLVLGTPNYLTLLKLNFPNLDADFVATDNFYFDLYAGSNTILNEHFITPRIYGKNLEIFDFKTWGLIPNYKFYYPLFNFPTITLTKTQLTEYINDYDEIFLALPLNLIFKMATKGCYFYFKDLDLKLKSEIVLFSNFNNKILEYNMPNFSRRLYLEPIGKSQQILKVTEFIPKEPVPKNIILGNRINTNEFVIDEFKRMVKW